MTPLREIALIYCAGVLSGAGLVVLVWTIWR